MLGSDYRNFKKQTQKINFKIRNIFTQQDSKNAGASYTHTSHFIIKIIFAIDFMGTAFSWIFIFFVSSWQEWKLNI